MKQLKDGNMHLISEGDTAYLGACTKGRDSSDTIVQPFSNEKAMKRAFSIKKAFMSELLQEYTYEKNKKN